MFNIEVNSVTEDKPSARGKRRDPNFAQLIGDVPRKDIQAFKINCVKKNLTIGQALTEAVRLWNEKVENESIED
jgi:hypothetical protein